MQFIEGIFGFGNKNNAPAGGRYTFHKQGNQYVVIDNQTGMERTFANEQAAKNYREHQQSIDKMRDDANKGEEKNPSFMKNLGKVGWATAKVAAPLAAGLGIKYGFNRLNKKHGLPLNQSSTSAVKGNNKRFVVVGRGNGTSRRWFVKDSKKNKDVSGPHPTIENAKKVRDRMNTWSRVKRAGAGAALAAAGAYFGGKKTFSFGGKQRKEPLALKASVNDGVVIDKNHDEILDFNKETPMREEWSMEIIHNFSEFQREAKAINMAAPKMSVSHTGGKTYMSHADDPEKKKKDPFGVNLAKPKMDVTHSGGKTTLRKFASDDQNIVAGMFDIKKKDLIKYGKAATLASPVGAAAYFGSKLKSERQWRKLPKWAQLSLLIALRGLAAGLGAYMLSGFLFDEIKTFKNPETGEDVRAES